jgi:hypothetical protein
MLTDQKLAAAYKMAADAAHAAYLAAKESAEAALVAYTAANEIAWATKTEADCKVANAVQLHGFATAYAALLVAEDEARAAEARAEAAEAKTYARAS